VESFVEILTLLAKGVGVGAVIAFLFEKLGWFQELTSQGRFWLIFALSLGLPLAAQLLLQFVPPEAWAAVEPYWQSLALGFLAWAGSQLAHKFANNRW
jgi:hypothetical protein